MCTQGLKWWFAHLDVAFSPWKSKHEYDVVCINKFLVIEYSIVKCYVNYVMYTIVSNP